MAKLPDGNKLIGENEERNRVSFYCENLNDNLEAGLKAREWIEGKVAEGTLTEKECEFVLTYWMQLYSQE